MIVFAFYFSCLCYVTFSLFSCCLLDSFLRILLSPITLLLYSVYYCFSSCPVDHGMHS